MAQVEDVAWLALGFCKHRVHLAGQYLPWGQQGHRVQIPLDGVVASDRLPGRGQGYPPVHADDLRIQVLEKRQQACGAGGKVNSRDARRLQSPQQGLDVGFHITGIVPRTQSAGPTVEDLHRLRAGVDLGLEVIQGDADQPLHEGIPGLGMVVHPAFGLDVVAGTPALDGVRSRGEGRAGKADKGHLRGFKPYPAHRLENEAQGFVHVHQGEGFHPVRRQAGFQYWAAPFLKTQPQPQRFQGKQDVREEDKGVHAQMQGKQRHLGGQVGLAHEFQQAVALPQRPVFGHVTPGLPHEPHRRVGCGLPIAGGEEGGKAVSGQRSAVSSQQSAVGSRRSAVSRWRFQHSCSSSSMPSTCSLLMADC